MQQPLQVTFHNLPHSDALEADIRQRMDRLLEVYERAVGARVVVDSPHRAADRGKTYAVRIELALPGHEIVVEREPHGDVRRAVADAFDAARRQLVELAARRRRS
jgi:ribosome-associated translation inhibitor RaiA